MSKKIRPFDSGGYFPIHNYVFDVCMPQLSNAGWRILCVAIRKTWGWTEEGGPMGRKEWDTISYSQFHEVSGLKSPASISKGLQECLDYGYLIRRQVGVKKGIGSPIYTYALDVNYEVDTTTDSVAIDTQPQAVGTENEASHEVIATENEVVIATVSVDTKEKKSKLKDEKKIYGPSKTWNDVLMELAMQTDKHTFQHWLKDTHIVSTDNGAWQVRVDSDALDWLENRFRRTIERTMQRHAPDVALEFVTA